MIASSTLRPSQVAFAIALCAVVVTTWIGTAESRTTASKGPVPPSAWAGGSGVDHSQLPEFVSALGRDGEHVGYVPREYLFPVNDDDLLNRPAPVYDETLRRIVGHMHPGRGYVPSGANPATVPRFEMEFD